MFICLACNHLLHNYFECAFTWYLFLHTCIFLCELLLLLSGWNINALSNTPDIREYFHYDFMPFRGACSLKTKTLQLIVHLYAFINIVGEWKCWTCNKHAFICIANNIVMLFTIFNWWHWQFRLYSHGNSLEWIQTVFSSKTNSISLPISLSLPISHTLSRSPAQLPTRYCPLCVPPSHSDSLTLACLLLTLDVECHSNPFETPNNDICNLPSNCNCSFSNVYFHSSHTYNKPYHYYENGYLHHIIINTHWPKWTWKFFAGSLTPYALPSPLLSSQPLVTGACVLLHWNHWIHWLAPT